MDFYDAALIQDLQIPVYETDPPTGSLNSPGLLWYNNNVGALRYTYNLTSSAGVYCIRTINCTR